MSHIIKIIKNIKQQNKEQKRQERRRQRKEAERQAIENQRMQTFEKLTQGKICSQEELETMKMKHQEYIQYGHYISILEKDSNGFNFQPREFMDQYYIPVVSMMNEIKRLKKNDDFIFNMPTKQELNQLDQKYFQSILLKYCFKEIRQCVHKKSDYNKHAVQKLILGKYSFERYINYHQRIYVTSKNDTCIDVEKIDVSVVPVPKFRFVKAIQEYIEEPIEPRNPMILNPIGAYANPMDYYQSFIRWCRHCAHYDNCPEALQEAVFELMGNEGKYKKEFTDPMEMLKFINRFTKKHKYFVAGFGGEAKYEKIMVTYIEVNGRYEIMRKVSRMLGHWGLSQNVKTKAYVALTDHIKVTHEQIRKMYLNPKELLNWLKAFIPKSYTSKDVDAAMGRHGFYYY